MGARTPDPLIKSQLLYHLSYTPGTKAASLANTPSPVQHDGQGALIFRTVHLFFIKSVLDGLVWFTKILTDPFHDVKMYYKAPLYLMRGELIDPMYHARTH